jgi:outer membrane protein assembly factor BamD (BamD/ComL family)
MVRVRNCTAKQWMLGREMLRRRVGTCCWTPSDRFSVLPLVGPTRRLRRMLFFVPARASSFADRYVKANELFEELLKDYPNSRYLDLIGARRFLIAQYWFEMDAGSTDGTLGVNLTKDTHPWSDTFGHAVRIFDRMRLDDPTGKLADDATIAAANAYFQKEDYLKADQYYSDLRTHFPSSEHQFMAHFLGIKAKLLGYRGPEFTGESLDEAETLIKQVRRQFPTESREHQDEIDKAFSEVRYRKAEREWLMAQYYDRRKEYGAARFYYDLLNEDYGDTPFADKARDRVGNIAGKRRAADENLPLTQSLSPAIPAARGMGEGTAESADRLTTDLRIIRVVAGRPHLWYEFDRHVKLPA